MDFDFMLAGFLLVVTCLLAGGRRSKYLIPMALINQSSEVGYKMAAFETPTYQYV